jgi:predicted dehydrogenase
LLADVLVDAVAVLTPPNTHLDIVSRCAVAGKHLLLEKPLEITTARAQALVAACRGAGVAPGIVPQHRRKPAVLIVSTRSDTPVNSGPAARNR